MRPGRGARFSVSFNPRDALARGGSDEAGGARPNPAPSAAPNPNADPKPEPKPQPYQAGSSGVEVEYGTKALGRDVALSYALTVHKSQGSEYAVVVLPVTPRHAIRV